MTRRFSVNPINRNLGESYHLFPQLLEEKQNPSQYYRMKDKTSNELLEICIVALTKETSNFKRLISPIRAGFPGIVSEAGKGMQLCR